MAAAMSPEPTNTSPFNELASSPTPKPSRRQLPPPLLLLTPFSIFLLYLSYNTLSLLNPPSSTAHLADLNPVAPKPTAHFSARVDDFFNASPCAPRFYMTKLSSSPNPLSPRELFAIGSVFRSHPDACLLILSDALDSHKGDALLRQFSENGYRVLAVSPDYAYLLKGTPAGPWYDSLQRGEVDTGDIPIGQNLSNLLRLAALYRYGGVYVDTDVIVVKSFAGLRNAIGAQSVDAAGNWTRLNNAVMVFDEKHPLLYEFILEFARTFNGSKWGHNGPYLVSRVAERVEGRPGFNFTVMPPPAFYPVAWTKIGGLLEGPRGGNHSRWVVSKHRWIQKWSFAVHLWNKQSMGMKVEDGSVIARIMMDCCLFCNSTKTAMEV